MAVGASRAAWAGAGETADVRAVAEQMGCLRPLPLLFAGDAEGNLAKLYAVVENQQKKVGAFDAIFVVGAFLPDPSNASPVMGGNAAAVLAEYVKGCRKAPINATYFIESRSAALLQSAPEGKQLFDKVHFLGGFGIREIAGLQVAYLSGHYDHKVFTEQAGNSAGPAFVGAAYTPHAIGALIGLAREAGAPKVDVLLTGEWPRSLEAKVEEAEAPKHPDGQGLDYKALGVGPVAELCAALEPRYHVFATEDIFYQRPPFQTLTKGHVCRCIALGKVGSKGKGRQWMHGLTLSPASLMPETVLRQRPENTTPCPFPLPATAAAESAERSGAGGAKRDARERGAWEDEEGENEGAFVVPDQVFLARLPSNIQESRIEAALKHVGKIERVHLARDETLEGRPCKGFGWVTFSSPEEAEAACDLSDLLECGGRKISICLSKPRARKKREIQILIEPHADCWFCLVNPKVERHMIVSASKDVYVATARGPVNPAHVLVMPVKHAPCFAACPGDLQSRLELHVAAVRRMCQAAGKECLVWERWIPMSVSSANHMQVQVLPIHGSLAHHVEASLDEVVKEKLPGAKLQKVASHLEVAQHLNDDSTMPYVYFEIPGDNTAKGRQIQRFLYVGVAHGPKIPINIGRMVACHLLDCDDRIDWRQCADDRDTEKELASAFREEFKPFQPAAKAPGTSNGNLSKGPGTSKR